jgi:hypothetical protein
MEIPLDTLNTVASFLSPQEARRLKEVQRGLSYDLQYSVRDREQQFLRLLDKNIADVFPNPGVGEEGMDMEKMFRRRIDFLIQRYPQSTPITMRKLLSAIFLCTLEGDTNFITENTMLIYALRKYNLINFLPLHGSAPDIDFLSLRMHTIAFSLHGLGKSMRPDTFPGELKEVYESIKYLIQLALSGKKAYPLGMVIMPSQGGAPEEAQGGAAQELQGGQGKTFYSLF